MNVDKIGDYEIVYKNGTKEAKAIVHVRDDSRLQVKDTTIYVGDSWKPEENFVSATDKTGQDVPFEKSLFQVKLIPAKQAFIQSYTVTKVKKKQPMWPSNPTNLS